MRALLPVVLLLAMRAPQDDLIQKLASDSIDERDNALAELERLPPDAIPGLEKALAKLTDAEVRARLESAISTIRKRAEFAKVFGPTKRVTVSAKGRPLKEILESFGEPVEFEGVDPAKAADLELKSATLWEALDGLARAAGVHYDYGEEKTVIRAGAPAAGPRLYAEQFRISVPEITRVDYRTAGHADATAIVVVEIRHQRNLKPSGDAFRSPLKIDTVKDAKGEDPRVEPPAWTGTTMLGPRPCALQETVYVRADAPGPLTITGTTDVIFPARYKTIDIPLAGERRVVEDPFTFTVEGFTAGDAETMVTLRPTGVGHRDFFSRIEAASIVVVDGDGKEHRAYFSSGADTFTFRVRGKMKEPKSFKFRWAMEFHPVELPFRLEGVKLPGP